MADKDINDIDLPEGFSGSELKASIWWVDHKDQVRRYAIAAFVVFDVMLLLIGLWGLFDWLLLGGVREEQAMRQLTSPQYLLFGSEAAIQEVHFGTPIVLSLPDARYDVVIPVENTNTDYWLELDYRIVIGGEESVPHAAFVLPGQSKFIAELAVPHEGAPGDVELKVESRKWHRIDPHEVPDYASFAESHLRFGVGTPTFTATTGDTQGGISRFTLSNDTAFTYHGVDVLVLLYRGDSLVGVNRVTLDRLVAGMKQDVELFWFQPLPRVTRTDVLVDVNILDSDSYERL